MLPSEILLSSYNNRTQVRAVLGRATVELGFRCSQGWCLAGEHWYTPSDLQPVFLHFGPASILTGWCPYCGCNQIFWNVTPVCTNEKDTSWNLLYKIYSALIFLMYRNHHADLGILSSLAIGNGNFCRVSPLLAYLVLRIFPVAGLGESFFCSSHVENLVLTFLVFWNGNIKVYYATSS